MVDAVHGNATIDERRGRAWGSYTANVSPYLIGYLVGRELEPHEVEETDLQHEGYRFIGQYLSTTKNATPTESWLAQSCDYLLSYEEKTYNRQTPVSIVNWPTLDYLEHDSERDEEGKKIREYNDRTTVDINHLVLGEKNKAGLFGSYHIYPNYPDFMNNEPSYDLYTDEEGRLRYGGYLKEFMDGHKAYPAVVAEFGIATGMGNAHTSPDGYHHGGLDEKTQAQGIIRMTMLEVGELWHQNKITVDKEHYCTSTTQMILSLFYPVIFSQPSKEKKIVTCCVGSELHEMGGRMVSDLFEYHGWESIFLGSAVPTNALVHAIGEHKPDLVALSVTMPQYLGLCHEAVLAIRKTYPEILIAVGGRAFSTSNRIYERWPVDIHTDLATGLITWADKVVK